MSKSQIISSVIKPLALAAALFSAGAVWADQGGFRDGKQPGGGFTGPGQAVTSVEQARGLRDDAMVSLRGNIIQHIGGDTYLFRDGSGSIHVDIDSTVWNGQHIGPTDTVKIDGEVDKDWNSVEIDVDRLTKE